MPVRAGSGFCWQRRLNEVRARPSRTTSTASVSGSAAETTWINRYPRCGSVLRILAIGRIPFGQLGLKSDPSTDASTSSRSTPPLSPRMRFGRFTNKESRDRRILSREHEENSPLKRRQSDVSIQLIDSAWVHDRDGIGRRCCDGGVASGIGGIDNRCDDSPRGHGLTA